MAALAHLPNFGSFKNTFVRAFPVWQAGQVDYGQLINSVFRRIRSLMAP
jgi:hypothetical protein